MSETAVAPLEAIKIDFLSEYNAYFHHTEDFDNTNLIVRRGQEFKIDVTFSRELNDGDKVILQLSIGENPKRYNGTILYLNLTSNQKKQPWHAEIYQTDEEKCVIAVTSPPDAMVGKYRLDLITGSNTHNFRDAVFYVLFNPWCEADSVFMPDEDQKAEYVLNDSGYLYGGSATHIFERPWNFGQFEEDILDCCMRLLDLSLLGPHGQRNPIHIARAMSALVNYDENEDDDGVILGNWSGYYEDGTSPEDWTGSVPILQQYYRNKEPVLYGQCWVFSGVLTTIMRCLGIPARSVTTYECAHDHHRNINIDEIYNEMGEKMNISDFTWNYHVWNDIWMKRPDLPKGYDGWQVVDGTPQRGMEVTEMMECGPAPVIAIKKGEVYIPYDTMFVFSEVNADMVLWIIRNVNGKEEFMRVFEDTRTIGRNISTKAVGKNEREDITDQYKFPEGSPEERKAMKTALSHANSLEDYTAASSRESPKAALTLGIEEEKALVPGQPISLKIVVRSMSTNAWTINLCVSCHLESYTGKVQAGLKAVQQTVKTEGKPIIQTPLVVDADMYMDIMSSTEDELLFKVNIFANVEDTHENLGKQITLTFQYPPLKVEEYISRSNFCIQNSLYSKKVWKKEDSGQTELYSSERNN
ncbi:protein-glutamine gamma-glutamyltransferase 4 isoform X2 [Anolis carolinensis]|uniref:protein-glutamine gamma-glutamyltransferase 4 isoform X2 n=1 Tax=Anolis carolinensis TaxID=28377 RepID=UPI0004627E30|nr:PREDICTED: protein-glutamine gamma-glutamyltransferase 4 isoform X2 [Anolis carolinensis]|eukprot:XP_008113742.1 PREDICTED: protein-glutamine gamma-glutamyltransferase 4 isoform X2 [Anolis carolinensis]